MHTREIAKHVKLKENTVDQRLRRALKKLRAAGKGGQTYAK
jgi:DNA-directed RNA polymerase specialized sigma24 family protein